MKWVLFFLLILCSDCFADGFNFPRPYAIDPTAVHKAGDETVAGIKVFVEPIVIPDTLVVARSGYVGFGTTDPQNQLDIRNNRNDATVLSISNTFTGGSAVAQFAQEADSGTLQFGTTSSAFDAVPGFSGSAFIYSNYRIYAFSDTYIGFIVGGIDTTLTKLWITTSGVVMPDTAGSCWRVGVTAQSGALTTTSIPCP